MEIKIKEEDISGFNEQAKKKLKKVISQFIIALIKEAHRLDLRTKTSGKEPEITSSIVDNANTFLRNGFSPVGVGWGMKILRVFAYILPFLIGILYDPVKLQDGTYMIVFILLITAAIVLVTISILKE